MELAPGHAENEDVNSVTSRQTDAKLDQQPKREEGTMTATVYIVDDDPATIQQLSELAHSVHMEAKGFGSAQAFLDDFSPDRDPGCLILDVRMPGMTGIQLIEKMRDNDQHIPTIMVTAFGDLQAAVTAMKSGAMDFLEKPLNMTHMLEQINIAIESDRLNRRDRLRQDKTNVGLNQLTARENQILERVLSGKTSKVIAQDLGISLKTVEAHRARIRTKMQVDNVIELIYRVVNSRSHKDQQRGI